MSNTRSTLARILFPFLAVGSAPLAAQCPMQWHLGAGTNGPHGPVHALLALPNGEIVAGGAFPLADQSMARGIARWNGTTWQALGTGTDAVVFALARLPNGDLVAGGSFTTMGGQSCNRVATWNGTTWTAIGSGTNATVTELLVLPNGEIVVAGAFSLAGGAPADRVAKWNGTTWSAVGTGLPVGDVKALAVMPNGDLVVGGTFAYGLQRLVGGTWQNMAGLDVTPAPSIKSLAVMPNGSLAISGSFRIAAIAHSLAILTGTTAQPLVQPIGSSSGVVMAAANGDLVLGGDGSGQVASLARWNGFSWLTWTGGISPVVALAEDAAGRVVAGATPTTTTAPACVARFNGTFWQTLGAGAPPEVRAAVALPNGDAVVGGAFAWMGGVPASNVARWNGASWTALGSGVDGNVTAIALGANGSVIVGGNFQAAGTTPMQRIGRWNGSAWTPLGSGLPFVPTCIVELTNGEVLAAANNQLRRWNGSTWSSIVFPGVLSIVNDMTALPGGAAMLVGTFLPSPTVLLYANGAATAIVGAPAGTGLRALTLLDGTVVVAHSGGVSRWDGGSWTALPGGVTSARGLAQLPNGDLIACGLLNSFGTPQWSALYRLDATGWQPFGDVLGGEAQTVAATARGEILVGGNITNAGGVVSAGLARATPTCPGLATAVGNGCNGLSGPLALTSVGLPFVGSPFRATATGLFTNSVALALAGLPSPAFPIPGSPGCFGHLNPLASDLLFPVVGTATMTLAIPDDPALFGVQLRLQVAAIEFGASASIGTTNALDITVGTL